MDAACCSSLDGSVGALTLYGLGTALGFMLFARGKGGLVPLAGAAVPLINSKGFFVNGKVSLRLWPPPELQMARDPKLGKGAHQPRNLNLFSGNPGSQCASGRPPPQHGLLHP